MPDTTFNSYYKEVFDEVQLASSSYLSWRTIQNLPADDSELLNALNRNPSSWILIRQSLMLSLIMSLGRIFDSEPDALSVDKLLRYSIDNINLFSRDSLLERKRVGWSDFEELTLDVYMDNTVVPVEADFQRLRGEVRQHKNRFDAYYRPLRNKIFAHKDIESLGRTDDLWTATASNNIEETLHFLNDLMYTLHGSHVNGKELELGNYDWNTALGEVDFISLLESLKGLES